MENLLQIENLTSFSSSVEMIKIAMLNLWLSYSAELLFSIQQAWQALVVNEMFM